MITLSSGLKIMAILWSLWKFLARIILIQVFEDLSFIYVSQALFVVDLLHFWISKFFLG